MKGMLKSDKSMNILSNNGIQNIMQKVYGEREMIYPLRKNT